MKASIKTIATTKGLDIYVELYENDSNRPRRKIGHAKTNQWDAINKLPLKTHPYFANLYRTLKNYEAIISDINFGNPTFNHAYQMLFGSVKPGADYISFFDVYAFEAKAAGKSDKTILDVKKQVEQYAGQYVPFNSVTYEWLNRFIIYKRSKGTGTPGIMAYLRTMRAVYKEAQRRTSLGVPPGNPFLGLIKTVAPRPPVELTNEHINKLLAFQKGKFTTKKNYEYQLRAIAVWLFQFYIGGHDYADVAKMQWTDITAGRVQIERYKNRNKPTRIVANNCILPEAQKIIEQYGTPGQNRVFGFIPAPREKKYKGYRRNVNRTLAAVSEQLEIPHISTKTPRYIFRTRAGNLLIHDILVAKIMAHKLEGITYRYQGTISPEIQDNAHRQIVKL